MLSEFPVSVDIAQQVRPCGWGPKSYHKLVQNSRIAQVYGAITCEITDDLFQDHADARIRSEALGGWCGAGSGDSI